MGNRRRGATPADSDLSWDQAIFAIVFLLLLLLIIAGVFPHQIS